MPGRKAARKKKAAEKQKKRFNETLVVMGRRVGCVAAFVEVHKRKQIQRGEKVKVLAENPMVEHERHLGSKRGSGGLSTPARSMTDFGSRTN